MKKSVTLFLLILLLGFARAENSYYFNPSGGRFYHQNPQCPSISEKYYSLLEVVTESQLQEKDYAHLTPCKVCGTSASENAEGKMTTDSQLTEGAYRIGVDIDQGLYFVTAGSDSKAEVLDWNGTLLETISDEESVVHLYNEQTLVLSQGAEARFMLALSTSALDTGSRNYVSETAVPYKAGRELAEGLYLVEAIHAPQGILTLRDAETAREIWSAELTEKAAYTVYLGADMELLLPEGCRLRSFTAEMIVQDKSAAIVQGRYLSGQQLPCGMYMIQAMNGEAGYVRVTENTGTSPAEQKVEPGEFIRLDLHAYPPDTLVEFINCIIIFQAGSEG